MHQTISTAALCFATAAWSPALGQQGPGVVAPTELLANVLSYRALVIEAKTPIDACSLRSRMKTPTDFPSAFSKTVQAQLNRRDANPCRPIPPSPPDTTYEGMPAWICRGHVSVDSLELSASKAKVLLSVLTQGDAARSEEYTVHFLRGSWVVVEVRIFGLLYLSGGVC